MNRLLSADASEHGTFTYYQINQWESNLQDARIIHCKCLILIYGGTGPMHFVHIRFNTIHQKSICMLPFVMKRDASEYVSNKTQTYIWYFVKLKHCLSS